MPTRALGQSTTDQFIQVASTAQSIEFKDVQTTVGSIVFNDVPTALAWDETQVIFNESGKYVLTASAHLIRVDGVSHLNYYFWPEIDTGSGFAQFSNFVTTEGLASLDQDEVHPVEIACPIIDVAAGDKIRFRMEADLLRNSGIVFVDNTKADPNFPGTAPSFQFTAIKI